MVKRIVLRFAIIITLTVGGGLVFADEGMWTLNNLPLKQLKDKYNFMPSAAWVEQVQKSSARLPNCSSSFVSSDGLLMTNWHCAEDAVQSLSTPRRNLYKNGFYARTLAEELKTNLNVRVLISMANVTQRINDIVANDTDKNPIKARQEAISRIQKDKIGLSTAVLFDIADNLLGKDSFFCEVVVLYQGGQHHNYCYRVYDDIRLVFALEKSVGFFGGDADNFEYPRYTLDVAFLRAYENNKPAKTPFHFKWSKSGAKEGELIFVSGHPGNTKRLLTSSALATERDVRVPFLLDLFRRRELTTKQFMLRGKEQMRIAESDLFSWQNSRKLYVGKIRGLQDPNLMEAKKFSEKRFFKDFSANVEVSNKYADGLITILTAQSAIREYYARAMLINRGLGFDSVLFGYAQSLVSGNQQIAQAALEARAKEPSLNFQYEEAKLRDSLTHLVEVLGVEDPIVKNSNNSPAILAEFLVYRTALSDINEHRRLVKNGIQAIEQSDDPMIQLAKFVKEEGKKYREAYNNALEEERRGYAQLSDALFRGYGPIDYPDATFTLRLSYGTIVGDSQYGIQPFTTIGGGYRHSAEFGNSGDYKLPNRWLNRKGLVNQKTPLNFISDLDITGGNSGSPVFNKNLEIVGIVFDSNIDGLVSDYDYNYSPRARAVSVHSVGIIEILKKIYRANRLVKELTVDNSHNL